jgi:hypothetical protein
LSQPSHISIRDDFDLVVSFAPPTDGTLYCRSLLRFSWRCIATPAYLAEHRAADPGRVEPDPAARAIGWHVESEHRHVVCASRELDGWRRRP